MRRLFLTGFLLASAASLLAAGGDNVVDEIAWVVGDEAILRSDVEEMRMRYQYEGTKVLGDPYCFIPEQLALQKLYLDQAKIDSISADEKNVSTQVDMRIGYLVSQIGSKEKVEEYFKKPMPVLKEELREMVSNQQVISQMQRKIVGDIKVTPAEVSRFFAKLPSDSVPEVPTKVEVQLITVTPEVAPEAVEEVKAKMREFQTRVESGDAEFSTLAILYSEDTESAKRGGEIGFLGKGQLVPEYANVAYSLQDPKKVSKIVESEFGFHIIQLIERRGDRVNTRHILMKPKVSLLAKDNAKKRLDSVATTVRKGVLSFDQAVSLYSDDKNTKNSLGLMNNPKTGTSKFQLQELPQEVAKVVYGLKDNEISEPFVMVNSQGKEVFAIVKLKSNVPAHRANVVDDYLELKEMCVARKREQKLEQWVREKQSSIYVRIDEKWRNCEFQYPGWLKE